MKSVKRNILLNPGPATTTDSVKLAQVVPDICPREASFGRLMESVSEDLAALAGDPSYYTTVLFSGSGTAAVESILSSVIDQEAVVIINNGAYGKRMCEIAQTYRLNAVEFASPYDEAIDLSALETMIQCSPHNISHLAVVHHETTVGLLNDIQAIGDLCRRYRIDMIVDAMSSFGAIPIEMEQMNISYMAASSNKNLQGMAGIAFVIANKRKLNRLKNKRPRNYYLDLYAQYQYFAETLQMRFTPPVQTFYALKQAIEELKREGVEARYARYARSWKTLIQGISRLGLKHLVEERHHSKLVTSILEPHCSGYDFREMHDFFYSNGFTIYPGKLEKTNTFRIANIGDITYQDIEAFLALLEHYLKGIQYLHRKADSI
ncbi:MULTISPECIES: 2-aminoethylphosphonate aminotransferase [unclassified Paenibacillus]|uniref:2-aminoethylphosphonate aminotransferase n=1 Tax=unclassified Paenibacillus TaxID=185978 RepID=UPI001C1014B2|nr:MULTISPECIES: 2-aminoethylphosphonate--pyruvate transaminase [unclassified Paenibacillus]MBU5442501.1 2-aminoethylphosphonate--pyruvate transaminase [Paenibacillus sp. MSJ-34]CAH0120839.1 2-aminoethylphosphonate--pyruvate transaminase [Paenibacillus sp. CECT 9249]